MDLSWWLPLALLEDVSHTRMDGWELTAREAIEDAVGVVVDYCGSHQFEPVVAAATSGVGSVSGDCTIVLMRRGPVRSVVSLTGPAGPVNVASIEPIDDPSFVLRLPEGSPAGRYTAVVDLGYLSCPPSVRAVVKGLALRRLNNPMGSLNTQMDPSFPAGQSISALMLSVQERAALQRYMTDGF
jgi:hypothetical protein